MQHCKHKLQDPRPTALKRYDVQTMEVSGQGSCGHILNHRQPSKHKLQEKCGIQGRGNGSQTVAEPWRLQNIILGKFHLLRVWLVPSSHL